VAIGTESAPSEASWILTHGGRDEETVPDTRLGAVVRAWRERSGQTQVLLAHTLGITQQYLSLIENCRRPLSITLRRRLVLDLGVPAEELGLVARQGPADLKSAPEVMASGLAWRANRRWLNLHRGELAKIAAMLYPQEWVVNDTPLIAHPTWRPAAPMALDDLSLMLDETPHGVHIDGTEPETGQTRPLRVIDERFERYTDAVRHLDPPRLFESRPSYRLLAGSLVGSELTFGLAAYFDKLDVCEPLAHELAMACQKIGGPPASAGALAGELPFRDQVQAPFAPDLRAIIPAVTTLTIRLRRTPAQPSFLLHWRDPAKVATAGGVYDVIPAGEFQPSSVALWDRRSDFDLWRNIVREFSEELLGTPEHDGTRTRPIDYDRWPLYSSLSAARRSGRLQVWILGMGLDALTLAATILTVVVVDDDVFTAAFGDSVEHNEEGEIVGVGGSRPVEGVPFTLASVRRLLEAEPMAPPGAACLALAWQHRGQLMGL
jgi:transcriptional regulator with XRE-family HTH domain